METITKEFKNILKLLDSQDQTNIALGFTLLENHEKEFEVYHGCPLGVGLVLIRFFIRHRESLMIFSNKCKTEDNWTPSMPLSLIYAVATFEENEIDEPVPSEIEFLPNLRELDLGNLELTEVPGFVCNMQKLTELCLYHNQINTLPPEIAGMKSLKNLFLNGNEIQTLPEEFKNLKKLKMINLAGNNIEKFPLVLLEIHNLEVLSLIQNPLSESLPLHNIKEVYTRYDQIQSR